jgi:hypothetical protein
LSGLGGRLWGGWLGLRGIFFVGHPEFYFRWLRGREDSPEVYGNDSGGAGQKASTLPG